MSLELTLRLCGISGIVASLGVAVADIFLYGRKDSFDRLPGLKRAIGFPFWRLNLGNALGVSLIPIVALGFVPLFYALRPIGLFLALLTTGMLVYFFGLGPSAHTMTAVLCLVHRERGKHADDSSEAAVLDSILGELTKMFNWQFIISSIPMALSSFLYSGIVLTGKTALPGWMSLLNPYLLVVLATFSQKWLPPKIAGYLVPTRVYIGITPLLILTLIHMWNVL